MKMLDCEKINPWGDIVKDGLVIVTDFELYRNDERNKDKNEKKP